MAWFDTHLLTTTIFLPLAWALAGLLIPLRTSHGRAALRLWSALGGLAAFGLMVLVATRFQSGTVEFQFTESAPWIPSLGVSYALGTDGISLFLALLTTFLTPLVILGSFKAIDRRERGYYFLLLALETGMLGAFLTTDIFLFYIFWEAMLIPMYFLIGIWGGQRRVYAAMKFFVYTAVGSLLMLVAIFYLASLHKAQFGAYSTAIADLYRLSIPAGGWLSVQSLLFLAFSLAFAIKVPLFPLHTWLPDAHTEAPTAGSVILAAVLLKMGGYGFVRFALPLFPDAVALYHLSFMILAAVAVVYGALMAMAQTDVKRLVAYSSVSHMGYVVLGLFSLNATAFSGSVYQMLNHGVSTGALFLLVGIVYERRHTREITEFGGLAKTMPLFAIAFVVMTFSSIAVPGTNGFVGEFLILLGSWKTSPLPTVIASLGVVLGAVYMLWLVQRLFFGSIDKKENEGLKDLSLREVAVLVPLLITAVGMGVFPRPFLDRLEPAVQATLKRVLRPAAPSTPPVPVEAEEEEDR